MCVCVPLYAVQYGRVCGLELVERLQAISDLITPSLSALRRSSLALSSLLLLIPSGQSSHLPMPLHTVISIPLFFFFSSSFLYLLFLCHVMSLFSYFNSHPIFALFFSIISFLCNLFFMVIFTTSILTPPPQPFFHPPTQIITGDQPGQGAGGKTANLIVHLISGRFTSPL